MNSPHPLARFPVSGDQIARVMQVFYARIRQHPELGPVFRAHIGETDAEWDAHIDKIERFWRNAILREKGYDGNPMQVHVGASDIHAEHFAPWLATFDNVLHQELPAEVAATWMMLATRIARAFQFQMDDARRPANTPPNLF